MAATRHGKYTYSRDQQSRPLEDDPNVRVSCLVGEDCKLIENYYDDVRTLYEGFRRGLRLAGDLPCLGTRRFNKPYVFQTYAEVQERITNFGSGLVNRGHIAGQGTFVGIASRNCPEWVIVEQACNAYSQVLVPLYDTLGPEAIEHIVTQAKTEVVVLSADRFIDRFRIVANTKVPKLVVKIGSVTMVDKTLASEFRIEIISIRELEEEGRKSPLQHKPPRRNDIATVCYTSGTTGKPKGVMLTHQNIVSNLSAAAVIMTGLEAPISIEDWYLSYLPLAHMLEREMQAILYMHGARICFFQGDMKLLVDDIAACRPTLFVSVPRLYNRLYDKTMSIVNSSLLKRKIFNLAMRRKKKDLENGIVSRTTIWDRLLFRRFQEGLGGRVRLALTGAAPIAPEVITFLRCALGCHVLEGYGQTEATAGVSITLVGESTPGHVGPPLPCNIVKVVDVPEMEYFAINGEGEVCCKGPNVFKGYLLNEEKTSEALDADGWLHSGDIGKWCANGCLKIIDRKKHIVKLSNGEYIAPEKIENCYTRHPAVMQAFVHANSLYPFPIAILVPDPDTFPGWAEKKGVKGRSLEEMCTDRQLVCTLFREVDTDAREYGLNSFERIKFLRLIPEPFSIENNLLTPTFKLRRNEVANLYKEDLEDLLLIQSESAAAK